MDKEKIIGNMTEYALNLTGSRDYCGMCLAFIEDCLEKSNGIEIFGGDCARESYKMYSDAIRNGLPENGAFVFYDCLCLTDDGLMDYGHCGISLGDGRVIHAWDCVRTDDYMKIEELSYAGNSPRYLGWVPIERVLATMRK